jgi:hypothetical protein
MTHRPTAVTTSCLSLALFVAMMALAATQYLEDVRPLRNRPTGYSYLDMVELSVGIFCAALAVWSVVIILGILRLRRWARLSALWLGWFTVLVSSLGLGSVAYMMVNFPGLGWSWNRVLPVSTVIVLATCWLILLTRPSAKESICATNSR